MTAEDALDAKALPEWLAGVVPLAFKDGSPIWGLRPGGVPSHFVTLAPPELESGEPLFIHLIRPRHGRTAASGAVRAIDRGGRLGLPAASGRVHVRRPQRALDIVRIHRFPGDGQARDGRQLSRLGRDDSAGRLVGPPTGERHLQAEYQPSFAAVSRQRSRLERTGPGPIAAGDPRGSFVRLWPGITRMEARTGLEVARVMAPPHGACSEAALAEMARVGFEAVCVSRGSLRHHNTHAPWTRTLGLRPCDSVAGLTVIPRFGLTKTSASDVLIAALFHQPIVPMTHHQALADGYDLLDETAAVVNALGDVAWRDMRTIARSIISRRLDGEALRVKLWSRHVTVPVPAGVKEIQVEHASPGNIGDESFFWREHGDHRWNAWPVAEGLNVGAAQAIDIACGAAAAGSPEHLVAGLPGLTPVVRRLLTEVRDRVLRSIQPFNGKRPSTCSGIGSSGERTQSTVESPS